jgi:hypothetical protein
MAVLAELLEPAGAVMVTLAIQAGHAARAWDWYRGGVLFLDLHGYDDHLSGPPGPSMRCCALGCPLPGPRRSRQLPRHRRARHHQHHGGDPPATSRYSAPDPKQKDEASTPKRHA